MGMWHGCDDWDKLLEEAHYRAILRGDIKIPPPPPSPTLEDYGRCIKFRCIDGEIILEG
jgi:hypothetical protein